MSDDTNFGENPFRALAGKHFPSGKKQAGPVAIRKAEKKSLRVVSATVNTPLDDADATLFHEAMSRVETIRHGGRARGFLLAEQCPLPEGNKARQKGKLGKRQDVQRGDGEKTTGQPPADAAAVTSHSLPPSLSQAGGEIDAGQEEQAEESRLFLEAMGQVRPVQGRGRDVSPTPAKPVAPSCSGDDLQALLESNLEFALSFTDEYLEGHVVGLDQMTMNKLRAGSLSPEAHLDLHGLNAAQAFEALRGFMRGAWYKGLRVVLVVPGRGRNSPDGQGVLRGKLQAWLTQEPFKRVVLAFCTAQPHDGGPGSVYVLLRKYRKKGRIYWERMPADADLYE